MLPMLSRPPLGRIAFLGITWYGLLICIGVIIAVLLTKREERRLELPADTAIDFALVAIPLGIIGARLYSVIFRLADYVDNPWSVFNLSEGGLAIAGAVLGGLLAAWLVARRKKISMLSLCDMAAPALILAQAIGRWGNYFNIEAYGLRINDPAWQFFPVAIEVSIGTTWYWHMATFFYEFAWNLLAFAALMFLRSKMRKRGDLFLWYVMLYGVGRAVIEGLRLDSLTFYNEFVRVSQILCALGCVAVAVVFLIRQRRVKRIPGASLADGLLLAQIVLALVTFFIGEFERGAYGNLLTLAQGLVLALLALNIAVGILRMVHRCPFHPLTVCIWLLALCDALLLIAGLGRSGMDNTMFVTMRQIPCMLQIALCGALCYFAAYPQARKRRTVPRKMMPSAPYPETPETNE